MAKVRKFFYNFILLIFFFNLTVFSLNLPSVSSDFFFNDFAKVLNNETKNLVMNHSSFLMERTGIQVVVATVESLENSTIDEYSIELARKWKIGKSGENTGVLILLAPNERKIRMEIGYGLEGIINDSKAGRFIRNYATPELKNNHWDVGIKNLYSAVMTEFYNEYKLDIPENMTDLSKPKTSIYDKISLYSFLFVIFLGIIKTIGSIIMGYRRRKKGNRFWSIDDDDENKKWWWWLFSGGSGGNFGSFGGSSGSSFSGGGGDFGGGGASSDF